MYKLDCERPGRGRSASGLGEFNARAREVELEHEVKRLKQVGPRAMFSGFEEAAGSAMGLLFRGHREGATSPSLPPATSPVSCQLLLDKAQHPVPHSGKRLASGYTQWFLHS